MGTIEIQPQEAVVEAETPDDNSAPYFSIDSESTADIDDAISITKVPEGYLIRVAIANASAHVPIGSPEDIDARRTAATSYAGTRIIRRMLPRRISEGAGSLVQGKLRKAVVLEVLLSETLDVLRFTPVSTKIRVEHRLSYDAIPGILENANEPLNKTLEMAAGVARALLQNRRNRGALARYDLLMMLVTDEDGKVTQMRSKGETIGYIIVQEMMIMANTACARYAVENNIPYVFRNHEAKFAAPPARDVAEDIGRWIVAGLPQQDVIRQRLDMIAGKAKYEAVCRGHYALNLPAYGHFTSPLRRYPDLLNQRQMVAHLSGAELPYSNDALAEATAAVNEALERHEMLRSEGFKAAVSRAGVRAVENGTLASIPDHELCAAIKACCGQDDFPEDLTKEIVRRCQAKEMTDKVGVCVLFEVDISKVPLQARAALLEWIGAHPGKSVSFCMIGQAVGAFRDVAFSHAARQGFECTLSVTFDDQVHNTSGRGNRKRDAEQSAARRVLALRAGVEITEEMNCPTQGATPGTKSQAPTTANPKGALLELCARRKLKMPEFVVVSSGPPHAPLFSCTATLKVGDRLETASAEGCVSKKQAEAAASEKLLSFLTVSRQSEPGSDRADVDTLLSQARQSENPVGALQEVAQKLAVKAPEYSIALVEGKVPSFICNLVTHHGGAQSYSGQGPSKQMAKVAAAMAALAGDSRTACGTASPAEAG